MLALDDPRWADLDHAYGKAADIPALLRQLASSPRPCDSRDEPWFSLWSSLCHQSDVYTASYAAVSHVVQIALTEPGPIDFSFFLFPARVEIDRLGGRGPEIPPFLLEAYQAALAHLMDCARVHSDEAWDQSMLLSVAAAQAVSKALTVLQKP